MNSYSNPPWWTKDYDSAWERVKAAMRRDWDQTKHDFGGDEPDTNQDLDDTVAQARGKQPIPPRGVPTYEEIEPAYRFGYGARLHYGDDFVCWDSDIEDQLIEDWAAANSDKETSWDRVRGPIRRGWDYVEDENEVATQPTGKKRK